MGRRYSAASVISVAAILTSGLLPTARATDDGRAINGTFIATSNGDWARTNEVYRDETSVRSVWTIDTTCTSSSDCAGQVSSDSGWHAQIYLKNDMWFVKRTLDQWEPCPDGAAAQGIQTYRFYPVDDHGLVPVGGTTTTWAGEDITVGAQGGCGHTVPLVITLPFKLVRVP
jgi:hypothetical protein